MRRRAPGQRTGFRVLGVDDGPFRQGQREPVLVVAPLLRGDGSFEGLLSTTVTADGLDATERLSVMVRESKYHPQLHYVLLDGVTLGGFNIVDLPRLATEVQRPVLAVMRRPPDLAAVRRAVARLTRAGERLELLERAGPVQRVGPVWCQLHGLEPAEAEELIGQLCQRARYPEPLRVAHLIAGGVVLGESGGPA